MVKKKKRVVRRKPVVKRKEPVVGFFSRLKDVLPEQKKETIRVKTFIVEKPVYVSANESRVVPPPQKYNFDAEPEGKIDSKRSRYSKRKREEVFAEEEPELSEEPVEDYSSDDDSFDESQEEQISEDEPIDDMGSLPRNHIRSRAMFDNVWWKKALFWAILVWLLILALEMAMHAMKLVEIDLTRQWWILLAGLMLISMIYFKFFEGKINI